MNSVEDRRQAFEQEIDKCKGNVELIFDEYSRMVYGKKGLFITTLEEIGESRNLFVQLGQTYINADNLLRNKEDWAPDVIKDLEQGNDRLRRWIHRRETPDFDMDSSLEIPHYSVYNVYNTIEHLVAAVKDAETARLSQEV